MRRTRSVAATAAAAAGALAAAVLLTGCDQGADTSNGITPGPKLPAGVTLDPRVAHYQLATPTLTPTP